MTKLSKGQISIELILLMMVVLLAGVLVSFHMTKFTFEGDILSNVREDTYQVFSIAPLPKVIPGYSLNISDVKISPSANLNNAWLEINDTDNDTYLWYYKDGTFKGLANTSNPETIVTDDLKVPLPHSGTASRIIFRSDAPSVINLGGTIYDFPEDIKKFEIVATDLPDNPIYYNLTMQGPVTSNLAYLDVEGNYVKILVTKGSDINPVIFEVTLLEGTIELVPYEETP